VLLLTEIRDLLKTQAATDGHQPAAASKVVVS
jgi:hypothetical protein